jgi:tRNA dimethylallyltransferase
VPPSTPNNQSEVQDVSPLGDFPNDLVAENAPKIVVIAGPTAVGKTHLGIELALRFDGEVVNADSRYLYRGMDIGVAKPDLAERRGVPHHLIDILDPVDDMSLALYQEWAMSAISDVLGREHLPLLVGGTPLYVNAVIEGWRIPRVPPNLVFRARLEEEAQEVGLQVLTDRLAAVDPVTAARSGANLRRVIRALEIYDATGVPMSVLEGKGPRPFQTLELGLTLPRNALYAATDRRVEDQLARGLVDEVKRLLNAGLSPNAPAMSALGYRQLVPYLNGEITLDEAVVQIQTDTHRYVRHQETWLRRNKRLVTVDVTDPGWVERAARLVEEFLAVG